MVVVARWHYKCGWSELGWDGQVTEDGGKQDGRAASAAVLHQCLVGSSVNRDQVFLASSDSPALMVEYPVNS